MHCHPVLVQCRVLHYLRDTICQDPSGVWNLFAGPQKCWIKRSSFHATGQCFFPRHANDYRESTVLFLDIVILVLWTSVDPLHWEREVIRQDQFGFILESQGTCTSDNWRIFLGALVTLHIALCVVACYMCYVSRNIPSRYSEHKYLTIAMVANLQVFAIGGTSCLEMVVCVFIHRHLTLRSFIYHIPLRSPRIDNC